MSQGHYIRVAAGTGPAQEGGLHAYRPNAHGTRPTLRDLTLVIDTDSGESRSSPSCHAMLCYAFPDEDVAPHVPVDRSLASQMATLLPVCECAVSITFRFAFYVCRWLFCIVYAGACPGVYPSALPFRVRYGVPCACCGDQGRCRLIMGRHRCPRPNS